LSALDELDRKLLQILSNGANSYEELAQICNVTRATVYRRISSLEEKGIIKNTIGCTIDFSKIGITPIVIGATIAEANQDKAIILLANNKCVKFIWRTYGDQNLNIIAFCTKGEEGDIIQKINVVLEQTHASNVSVSVGFVWEKMDFSPFDEQVEMEQVITQVLQNRH
jgi:DNA-binding Lrp family transcriptional regulator